MQRIPMWLGIGAVTAGVSAAALAGAGAASAETEDGSGPPAATSAEQSTAEAESEAPDVTEEPVDEEPVDEEPVDEEPVDEEPVDEEPVEEEPTDEVPVDEEPADDSVADDAPISDGDDLDDTTAPGDEEEPAPPIVPADDTVVVEEPAPPLVETEDGPGTTTAVMSRQPDEPGPVAREFTAPPVSFPAPGTPLPSPFPFLDQLPPLARAIGSVAFDLIGAVVKVFTGPPQLPPGSTVSVRTSTLEIADGHRVTADWYFPAGDVPPERMIYLQHGFLAIGPMYSYTAAHLAERTNSVVVAPTLTSNPFAADGVWLGGDPMYRAVAELFTGDREAVTASAVAAGYTERYGPTAVLPDDFVLVGHSLGGGFVAGVAGQYARAVTANGRPNHLAGVISLDGVPPRDDIVGDSLEALDDSGTYVPFIELHAPTNYLNSISNITEALDAGRDGKFHGVELNGGVHMDSMLGSNPIIQLAAYVVAGFPQPQNPPAAQQLMAGWINDMFDDRINAATGACAGAACTGTYGPAGSTVEIPTGKGRATATVLGTPPATLRSIVPASLWRPTRTVLLPVA
ncbi:alpha/beta hydrolase [Mycolicibacterium baixiangningiae]|uniref:alpha/beta hydrolase n=1 Tax=Mycolicibacterium baixiangningiae TaxID=2761578 RepID=UPI0018D18648|nr:alpha/beta hydrolase [Mycolicibacterium baixiangningiae]